VVQRLTSLATTASFGLLAPKMSPSEMTGPMRVAYGPLAGAVALQRPLVMVPGFAMEASSFGRLAEHLATNPKNCNPAVFVAGENKFRDGTATGPVLSPAEVRKRKIFMVQYADPFEGPTPKVWQLAQALRALRSATRAPNFDAVSHSEGRVDLGLYLELQRVSPTTLPMINNWAMIGPPTQGTVLANIGSALFTNPKAASAAAELAVGSETIRRVFDRWPEHRSRIPGMVKVISMTGVPTLTTGGWFGLTFEPGDGFMAAATVGLEGAKTVLLPSPHALWAHVWEPQYSGVINEVMSTVKKKGSSGISVGRRGETEHG
jgi:hypothetical protein